MDSEDSCAECERLRREASAAVQRHIRGIDRLELARLRRDTDVLKPLEIVVNEAAATREHAVAALKDHLAAHRESGEGRAKDTGASGAV